MGIGVSYTGNGGRRTFELDGVPAEGSVAAGLLGPQRHSGIAALLGPAAPHGGAAMPNIPALGDDADRGKVKIHDGDTPEVLSRKLSAAGSISTDGSGLCLKGEEGGTPGGRRVYSSLNGMKGFHTLDQLDAYSGGIPLMGAGETPDGNTAQLNGSQGASIRLGGRTFVKVEIDTKGRTWLVVKDFYRMADLSPYGRIVRVSKEIEVPVARLKIGDGSGKYGVRLFSTEVEGDAVHPIPNALAFGAEADLDTYDPETGKFASNYEGADGEEGEPKVKVVLVTPNTGGTVYEGGE